MGSDWSLRSKSNFLLLQGPIYRYCWLFVNEEQNHSALLGSHYYCSEGQLISFPFSFPKGKEGGCLWKWCACCVQSASWKTDLEVIAWFKLWRSMMVPVSCPFFWVFDFHSPALISYFAITDYILSGCVLKATHIFLSLNGKVSFSNSWSAFEDFQAPNNMLENSYPCQF